jgi:hypothetical protein
MNNLPLLTADPHNKDYARMWIAIAYCSRRQQWWRGNLPIDLADHYHLNDDSIAHKMSGPEKLAHLMIGVKESWLTTSHIPKYLETYQPITFKPFGYIRFVILPSKSVGGSKFIRSLIQCPYCNQVVAMGRFHQHRNTHIEWTCSTCGDVMPMSKRIKHLKKYNHWKSNG